MFDFTAIPLCGIDDAESTTTLFEDDAATTTTTEPIKDQDFEASDKVTSKDDASIFGGESEMIEHGIFPSVMEASDDVPSSAFIHGDGDEMVEHGIFPSTTAAYDDELGDLCHHIESESDFTTSPIYDELPQFPCEESHNPHHLSEMSDPTICEFECTYFEGASEPPQEFREEVDRSCEAILISKDLTSTSIVSSHLVQGPIYDDAPILDDFVPSMDKTMAMVEYDAPPTWFHQDGDDDHNLVFPTSPTPHVWNDKGNIGEGDALVPLVDIDCLHDVDPPIDTLLASMISPCDDLPIYDEFDDCHVESISCDAMLHRISCDNSLGHIMFDNPLNLSYAMHEINNMSNLQSHRSNYAYAMKMNPICTYGIDDKPMVIGICFSCDDIDMLPLHHVHHMPCHDHLASDMHCLPCFQYSPCNVSAIAHEETPIVSSYMLGDFDPSHPLHDPNTCVHNMLTMNNNAIDVPYTCMLNLCLHRVIHNNYSFMMDDMFLYHASNFFEHFLSCANSHVHIHIMMHDVYIYHAHTLFHLSSCCVGTHDSSSTSQAHELTKRALESNHLAIIFVPLSLSRAYLTYLSHILARASSIVAKHTYRSIQIKRGKSF
jgi:hypothetical protein